jgi:hypothetical protein
MIDQHMKRENACDGLYPIAAAAAWDNGLEDELWHHTYLINQTT